jgi:hypothetical protein
MYWYDVCTGMMYDGQKIIGYKKNVYIQQESAKRLRMVIVIIITII